MAQYSATLAPIMAALNLDEQRSSMQLFINDLRIG